MPWAHRLLRLKISEYVHGSAGRAVGLLDNSAFLICCAGICNTLRPARRMEDAESGYSLLRVE